MRSASAGNARCSSGAAGAGADIRKSRIALGGNDRRRLRTAANPPAASPL